MTMANTWAPLPNLARLCTGMKDYCSEDEARLSVPGLSLLTLDVPCSLPALS